MNCMVKPPFPTTTLVSPISSGVNAKATTAALAVLLIGAGVLVPMWLMLPWPEHQHAWPDFRSGSFGDAVLLPTLTFALVRLAIAHRTPAERYTAGIPGSLLGAGAGAAVQWIWWSDPQESISWAFIAPHQFSLAGWWHAGFFVAVGGLLAGLAFEAAAHTTRLSRIHPEQVADTLRHNTFLVAFSMTAFAGALVLDALPTGATLASRSSLIAMGVALLASTLLLGYPIRRYRKVVSPRALLGLLTGASLTALMRDWPPSPLTAVGMLTTLILGLACDRWMNQRLGR